MPIPLASRLHPRVARSAPYLRARDLLIRCQRNGERVVREDLARRYLAGSGIEVGSSTATLRVPPEVKVRHVADAERLAALDDDSVDFAIALGVLDEFESRIQALRGILRVVRSGGPVLLVLAEPADTTVASRHPRQRSHTPTLRDVLELLLAEPLACEIVHAQSSGDEYAVVLTATQAPARTAETEPITGPASAPPASIPPTVAITPDETITKYTRSRLRQHTRDSYAGVPLSKFPEDLRVYEHLLWMSDADVVIELGVQFGASSLWFRDRLNALSHYRPGRRRRVISVDVDLTLARRALADADRSPASQITLIEASVTDPSLPDHVTSLIDPGARCLVIEDTAHVYDTTLAALRGFAGFVPMDGFFVVEDGCVDVESLRIDENWPRGVLPALRDWLATEQGDEFTVRSDLELYGVTCHPGGFLQRRGAPAESARAR
jgi:cephalosporin hydroxylase